MWRTTPLNDDGLPEAHGDAKNARSPTGEKRALLRVRRFCRRARKPSNKVEPRLAPEPLGRAL